MKSCHQILLVSLELFLIGMRSNIVDYFLNFVQEHGQKMNFEAPLCMEIASFFTNPGHLLHCKNRHVFRNETHPSNSIFNRPKTCQIEVLHVFSPACFSVRITAYRDTETNEWNEQHLVKIFEKFNEEFNAFYTNDFQTVQGSVDIDKLYVIRIGDKFMRCRIVAKM